MATKKHSSGGFLQMPKMLTNEPSVILKLKKGGHVGKRKEVKEDHGHTGMRDTEHSRKHSSEMEEEAEEGASPKKPSMAERRKAMNGSLLMSKKGGKVEKEIHKVEKELKKHEHEKAGKAHHGLKTGGRAMDVFETKTTIEGNERPYLKSKMMDGEHHDKHHGTGSIKEGKTAGFKHGGKVHKVSGHAEGSHEHHKAMAKYHAKMHKEAGSAHHHKMHEHHKAMCSGGKYATGGSISEGTGNKLNKGRSEMGGTIEDNEKDYERTEMHSAKRDRASGTKGIKETNAGGFKTGGMISRTGLSGASIEHDGDWENKAANGTPKGKVNMKTGLVREANAGGFKKGGSLKKHYATGGSVNDEGKATPMAHHFISEPVSNSRQSGAFKKGGHIKKLAMGGMPQQMPQQMPDEMPEQMPSRSKKPSVSAMKKLLGMGSPMPRKKGGSTNC